MIPYLYIVAGSTLAAAAIAGTGAWTARGVIADRDAARTDAKWSQAAERFAVEVQQAEQAARTQEQTYAENTRKAADAYAAQQAKTARLAAAARSQLGGLRDALAAADQREGSHPAIPACRADGAGAARAVVRDCAAALVDVGAAADAVGDRLTGLQDFVRATQ